jgi:hypothetical protein
MQEGGDRGKAPNKTGTQPKKKTTRSPQKGGKKKAIGGTSPGPKSGPRKRRRGAKP